LWLSARIAATVSLAGVSGVFMGTSHWENSAYCWVVICKNEKLHRADNVNAGHKIPLAETDAFAPAPAIGGSFMVLCDDCGKEYSYEPKEVLRLEMELPASLKTHPLFR
jgi:hypothetical protein